MMRKTVAVIPARGGSKGIKGKNLALLRGRPLLAYAIECGLGCPQIDRVIVSTDDPAIRDKALELGAEAPFLRPTAFAQDDTPDRPVFVHCIEWLRDNEGYTFDWLANLRCTTPLKRPEHVLAALAAMAKGGCESVRTVDRIQGKHHPYWMLRMDEQELGSSFVEGVDRMRYHQRQLLPPAYSINALVDVMDVATVLSSDTLYGQRMRLLVTDPRYSIDIDGPEDLMLCEALMERLGTAM